MKLLGVYLNIYLVPVIGQTPWQAQPAWGLSRKSRVLWLSGVTLRLSNVIIPIMHYLYNIDTRSLSAFSLCA